MSRFYNLLRHYNYNLSLNNYIYHCHNNISVYNNVKHETIKPFIKTKRIYYIKK